jgi:hypothetical protein
VVWEEHKVIGFEKRALIRKFGSKRVEVTWNWTKLNDGGVNNLHQTIDINGIIK